MLSDLIKKLLYASGALGLYHRLRNARTLTVIMFHRVLVPGDPRWLSCDPDYTLRADHFDRCLRFFESYYNTVSLADVLAARRGDAPLPPRALLVTFDDGWSDNLEFAAPCLLGRGIPGVMFVVADAIDRRAPFYQEQIIGAWRRGTLDARRLAEVIRPYRPGAGSPTSNDVQALRSLIAMIEALNQTDRDQLLDSLLGELRDDDRHMVNADELRQLQDIGVSIGLHGKTHIPMTQAVDLDVELSGARNALAAHSRDRRPPTTMSFPHGRFDDAIAARARESGYELVFTSVPVTNRATRGRVGWLLGRLGFETDTVVDATGRFRDDWLALYLFRRPSKVLA